MKSFDTFISESTINVETVKSGIIHYINDALKSVSVSGGNVAATIKIGKHRIQNVAAAKPSKISSQAGIIPYTDIDLILTNGQTVRIGIRTAKDKKFFLYRGNKLGRSAVPALQLGINSLDKMIPEIREEFVSSLLNYYTSKGYTHGTTVPDVYGKISEKYKSMLLLGDNRYGGTADYIIAIDRVSFRWNKFRIPSMKHSFKRSEFVIEIGDSRAFDASEVIANNEIYIWAKDNSDRTLYLGNDKVDTNNLPAVLGPRATKKGVYGIQKYKVGLNINPKMSFTIEDNKRVFKLELKSPEDLNNDSSELPSDSPQLPPGRSSGKYPDRMYGRDRSQDVDLDRKEYGSTLSPDEREEIIDKILSKTERGHRHRFKKDLDSDQLEQVKDGLEDLEDLDLKRLDSLEGHRLAVEIRNKFL